MVGDQVHRHDPSGGPNPDRSLPPKGVLKQPVLLLVACLPTCSGF